MKRLTYIYLCLGLIIMMSASCDNDPGFPEEPIITFEDIQPRTVRENVDSMVVRIRFTDGNGDLGDASGDPQAQNFNMFVEDNRVNSPVDPITPEQSLIRYKVPNLTPDTKNPAIQGTIILTIVPTVIRLGLQYTEDTTSFNIYIVDRAGNKSNTIRTESILITR